MRGHAFNLIDQTNFIGLTKIYLGEHCWDELSAKLFFAITECFLSETYQLIRLHLIIPILLVNNVLIHNT